MRLRTQVRPRSLPPPARTRVAVLLFVAALGLALWLWRRHHSHPPPLTPATPATPLADTNRATAPPPPPPPAPVFVPPPSVTGAPPPVEPPPAVVRQPAPVQAPSIEFPRPPRDVLEAQIALARRGISPGLVDGVMGPQTRAAILAFQRQQGLRETLELDAQTRARLLLDRPPLSVYTVTPNDLARLQPLSSTWRGKALQSALEYETLIELLAEKARASQNLIRRLNPHLERAPVPAGTVAVLPDTTGPETTARAAFVVICLGEKKLQVFDARTNLLAHFPCSIAARVEKRPVGLLHVTAIAPNPNYTFDPAVFPESAEARQLNRKLILPPGPNNPVGTAWISLDKPGYGIHGTPHPEQIGRTESHGCFRLANWNAEFLLKLVWIGMPVYVEP